MTTLMGGYAELAEMDAADGDAVHLEVARVPRIRTHFADDLAGAADAHRLGIWRYLRFLGCGDAAADDLTQETFLAVARGAGNGDAVRDVPAYLRGIARNLFLKWVRRSRREPPLEELDLVDEVWNQFAADDAGDAWIEAIQACVERLNGRGREAIELHYRQEQSREQIARR